MTSTPTGPRLRGSARLFGIVLAGLVPIHGSTARAAGRQDDKRACAVASEEAQLLRIHAKLRAAREQLLVCARDVCPALVKHDCDQWLAEVDASMPTVVISALDAAGRDVGDVRVRVDDEPFLERLAGAAAPIDAGEHVLRFQHGDDPPIEQRVIVREGEKNRLLEVHLQPIVPLVPSAPRVDPPPVRGTAGSPSTSSSILGYALLGAGAVSLGFGAYFEITQVNDYATLKNTCSPTRSCKQSDVDAIANDRVYGAVTLAAGVVAAGAGVVLLVTRPRATGSASPGTGAWLGVRPVPGGGAFTLRGAF